METHGIKPIYLFWYCSAVTVLCLVYQGLITFIPIPEKNVRFADVGQGFLLGSGFTAAVGFLLGGTVNQTSRKNDVPSGKTTAQISGTITSVPDKETPNDSNNSTNGNR